MTKLFIAVLMFLVTPVALGQLSKTDGPKSYTAVSDDGTIIVVVVPQACQAPPLDLLRPEVRGAVHKAELIVKGQVIQACWTVENGGDTIVVIDKDSEGVKVPTGVFKPTESL